jgi:hypothetical protein
MNRTILLILCMACVDKDPLLGEASRPGTYLESCTDGADCSGDQVCETVYDPMLHFYGDEDTATEGYEYQACTLECETDEDCPESIYCDGHDICYEGLCMEPNCA